MTRKRAFVFGLVISLCSFSCSRGVDSSPTPGHARLSPEVVAKTGDEEISRATVERIARAQAVTPEIACDRAVRDALFATAARAEFRDRPLLPVLERAAVARALLEGMKTDAAALGPPTDAELRELAAQRWREFDRPEATRTVHAVALVTKPEEDAPAHAVADRVYQAVRTATSADDFMRRAGEATHEGVELRIERLPAVTADGLVFDPDKPSAATDQTFDPDFAKAAIALSAGQISAPTKTRFGYHVIFCDARLPALRVPLDELRPLLHDEVIKGRAERAKQELLTRLGAATPVEIVRAVDDLTARVRVGE